MASLAPVLVRVRQSVAVSCRFQTPSATAATTVRSDKIVSSPVRWLVVRPRSVQRRVANAPRRVLVRLRQRQQRRR